MASSLAPDMTSNGNVHSSLDSSMYFYQNPHTGATVSTPLTIRQLCRMLCPVREGMSPILTPQTRCVQVNVVDAAPAQSPASSVAGSDANGNDQETNGTAGNQQQEQQKPPTYSYGEWKLVNDIPILREAACAQWYYSIRTTSSEASTTISGDSSPQGPVSCRTLTKYFEGPKAEQDSVLVFAQGITDEWSPLDKVKNLMAVLEALTTQKSDFTGGDDKKAKRNDGSKKDMSHSNDKDGTPSVADLAVQDELEAFLSSTADDMDGQRENDEENEAEYVSDGGTTYVKDPITGNWIHEALAPPRPDKSSKNAPAATSAGVSTGAQNKSKKKRQKAQFSKRNAKCWVYVTGLPAGDSTNNANSVTTETVAKYFSKVGLLDLDPETLQPKVKLYRDSATGKIKGDASVCYARPESVELALSILDESPWDSKHTIKVQRATFQAKNDGTSGSDKDTRKRPRRQVSEAQRKVAKLALLQAQDEGFGGRLSGGRKGLRIIIVRHMLDGIPENRWEDEVQQHSQDFGQVEKITVISEEKLVIIKFVEPSAARDAIAAWHGQRINPKSDSDVHAIYWDGVTDYVHTIKQQEKSKKEEDERHDQFGKWLDSQEELPPELRLQVEES